MKKSILIIILLLPHFSFAQSENEKQKEKKYKWGCSVAINSTDAQFGKPEDVAWGFYNAYFNETVERADKSYSVSVLPKYYVRPYLALRLDLMLTKFNVEINSNSENSLPQINHFSNVYSKSEQNIYRISAGFQYNIMKYRIVHLNSGFMATYSIYNKMKHQSYSEVRNTNTDSLISSLSDIGTTPGGYNAGICMIIGLNFFVCKNISVGGELTSSFLYYKIGGNSIGNSIEMVVNQPAIINEYSLKKTTYDGFQFSKIMSSLNISIWF